MSSLFDVNLYAHIFIFAFFACHLVLYVFVSLSQAPSAKAPQAAGARGLAPNLSGLDGKDFFAYVCFRTIALLTPYRHDAAGFAAIDIDKCR